MADSKCKAYKEYYRIRKEVLGLTREQAVEKMDGMHEAHLVRLENGDQDATPSDIKLMAEAYDCPELKTFYCDNVCDIGKCVAPEYKLKDNSVHSILVNMVVCLESANKFKLRLMEILQDGKVSDEEFVEFKNIKSELEKIAMTVEALKLWCEKNGLED